ncbi:class I adenylate-forming enzyme family protein [uncultured Jatrophihabitans sp.]|uniref:class I adenylate-forming enzyme family protein n=1 Tax=uncultured Jatrophihabitans sp. TaxID=1610747 RepID=UPI0035CAE0D4
MREPVAAGETESRPGLVQAILDRARDSPDAALHFVALDGTAEHVTLRRFVEESLQLAAALRGQGLISGDVVATRGGNSRSHSRAVVAGILAGVTVLPLVSILGDADVEQILTLSGTRLLLSDRRGPKHPLTHHLAALARSGRPPVALSEPGDPIANVLDLDRDGPPWSADRFPSDQRAPAFLLYTSGTTGVPKGVLHGHASILAEVIDWGTAVDVLHGGHVFNAFPLGHVAGLDSLLVALCLGRELTMLAAWDAAVAADALERYGATGGGSSPFYATTLFDEFDARNTTRTTLVSLQSGGGVVGAQLVRRAERYGISMVRAYGSTEHPSATSCRTFETLDERAETDGRPTGDTEIRIVDEAGAEVPDGRDGEVWLRGSEQFLGYLSGDRSHLPGDGWFRTGDLGRMVDGRLTITGRMKDIVIRGGENISVFEVERLLSSCPGVLEAAVVGVPDDRYGERVYAFVVRSENGPQVDLASVRAHFAELGVARYKTPEWVEEVAGFPRSSLGKVQKHLLVPAGD